MKWITYICLILLTGCTTLKERAPVLPLQHTVQPGETVAILANRYYGEGRSADGFQAILNANPQLKKPLDAKNPLVLTIPKLEDK
jgi:hypothetical protein